VSLGGRIFSRKFNPKTKKFAGIKKIAKPVKLIKDNQAPSVAMLDDGSFTVLWAQGNYDEGSLSATARFVPGKKKK